jgi:hypothetical protein
MKLARPPPSTRTAPPTSQPEESTSPTRKPTQWPEETSPAAVSETETYRLGCRVLRIGGATPGTCPCGTCRPNTQRLSAAGILSPQQDTVGR